MTYKPQSKNPYHILIPEKSHPGAALTVPGSNDIPVLLNTLLKTKAENIPH